MSGREKSNQMLDLFQNLRAEKNRQVCLRESRR